MTNRPLIEPDFAVLTLYARGGGKVAKHGWVAEAVSIGAVSYIPIQVWQQVPQRRHFCPVWHEKTQHLALPRFNHLPSSRFLLHIPPQFIRKLPNGSLEMNQAFYEAEFLKFSGQLPAIIAAVNDLVATLRKRNNSGDP